MNILRLIALSLVTMVMIPMSVNAHPCENPGDHNSPDHPHCSNVPKGGGGQIADGYSAVFTGEITGGTMNQLWNGGQRGVGLNMVGGIDSFISSLGPVLTHNFGSPAGATCFFPTAFTLHAASVTKGKKGRAQATLWFNGHTDPMLPMGETILYALEMTGKFDKDTKGVDWPPPAGSFKEMNMTTWLTHVEAAGDVIKIKSCIAGPVDFGGDKVVTIKIEGFSL